MTPEARKPSPSNGDSSACSPSKSRWKEAAISKTRARASRAASRCEGLGLARIVAATKVQQMTSPSRLATPRRGQRFGAVGVSADKAANRVDPVRLASATHSDGPDRYRRIPVFNLICTHLALALL